MEGGNAFHVESGKTRNHSGPNFACNLYMIADHTAKNAFLPWKNLSVFLKIHRKVLEIED